MIANFGRDPCNSRYRSVKTEAFCSPWAASCARAGLDSLPPALPADRPRQRQFIAEVPDIEILGECEDGRRAVSLIRSAAPDLLDGARHEDEQQGEPRARQK